MKCKRVTGNLRQLKIPTALWPKFSRFHCVLIAIEKETYFVRISRNHEHWSIKAALGAQVKYFRLQIGAILLSPPCVVPIDEGIKFDPSHLSTSDYGNLQRRNNNASIHDCRYLRLHSETCIREWLLLHPRMHAPMAASAMHRYRLL